MPATAVLPLSRSEQNRRRQLVVTKRRATTLLAAVSLVFLIVTVWGGTSTWAGYLQATAVASMVGGLADWFAVTALFRRPLGLPIPHTAIVVERKDQFATTLGEFIQESFLTPEVIVDRVRAANPVDSLARWLSEPANAARLAAEVADAGVAITELVHAEDVHRAIDGAVHQLVDAVALAPLAGHALRLVTADGEIDDLLDRGLLGLNGYIDEHREELRQHLSKRSRRWLPSLVDHKLFDRVLDGVSSVLVQMQSDHDHELRKELRTRLEQLIIDLETSPELRARGERLKQDVLARPEVQQWIAALWVDVKGHLRAQASDPGSTLQQRLTTMVMGIGVRLQDDRGLAAKVEGAAESAVSYVAEHFNRAIAGMVSSTIARWDADETATRLELLLGPDLQYVRINGTVMGAGAGLLLHGVARVLG
ncbi:MAG: hypothetical protein QOF20_1181 [Acidimicrobiaceae bacterium]|nr:hypothetical protein [Acidimicrobiaceae bacterium]